jgi:hypothetical protein
MCKLSVILVSFLILIGCSQWGGSNPVGVTGGSESGYGATAGEDVSIDYVQSIIGTWENEEFVEGQTVRTVVIFGANKNVSISRYVNGSNYDYMNGTYQINGSVLTLMISGETLVLTCSIRGNKLYTTDDEGVTVVYTRVT